MGYSIDPVLTDCYPGTSVLINKFDIRNEEKLKEVESVLTSARSAQWLNAPQIDTFDFDHYKRIHHFIFSDLYDWAGKIRTINISKKGTHFTPTDQIEDHAVRIFSHLEASNCFRNMTRCEFVDQITDLYCTTNALHPFREGNGRTQRVFLTQLARSVGYDIDFSQIDTDLLMIATIQASQGVTDLLTQLFREIIV